MPAWHTERRLVLAGFDISRIEKGSKFEENVPESGGVLKTPGSF